LNNMQASMRQNARMVVCKAPPHSET